MEREEKNNNTYRSGLRLTIRHGMSGWMRRWRIVRQMPDLYAGVKAFTLIELLVVVLIIGILSAIALPQYKKAVMNAKMAQIFALAGTYQQAIDVWLLENGGFPTEIVALAGISGDGKLSINNPLLTEKGSTLGNNAAEWNSKLQIYAWAQCETNPTSCFFRIGGYGTNGWLGSCGLHWQKGPTYGWILTGVVYNSTNTVTNTTIATKDTCPEVLRIGCKYAKEHYSGYSASGALRKACETVGIILD